MSPLVADRLDQLKGSAYLPAAYVTSWVQGRAQRAQFDGVVTYCMFIGHARSGHSLVGSLLTAHPDVVIAHELDALRYVRWRFGRDQLCHLILQRDREFTQRQRLQTKTGYQYAVPGQWQGRFRELRVIGDKKGGASTRKLGRQPKLLDRLQRTVGVPVRLVNITRNPYDNIATISRRSGRNLEVAAERYFERCATVQQMRTVQPEGMLHHLRYESFTADPKASLRALCAFVGVDAPDDYLSSCAEIVFPSPRQSRVDALWTDALVNDIARQIDRFDFLAGYSFRED
ncbi:MAG TPA: sulfotransferase [Acidimicrobiales bacterium]|nr:sulfotransferase [Acidimicrobiales bacterium]